MTPRALFISPHSPSLWTTMATMNRSPTISSPPKRQPERGARNLSDELREVCLKNLRVKLANRQFTFRDPQLPPLTFAEKDGIKSLAKGVESFINN